MIASCIKRGSILVIALVLAACSGKEPPKKSRAERNQNDEKALAAPPTTRAHNINGHQVLVVSIPVKSYFGVEYQTCFVWRDHEYKTASIHCGQQPEIDFSSLESNDPE